MMEDLQQNRLYCASCRCLRRISEYRLKDGLRLNTCVFCCFSYQMRRKSRPPRHEKLQDQESYREPYDEDPRDGEPRYCSSCNQLREASLFGRFLTCQNCRTTNKKAERRRRERRPPRRFPKEFAEDHLRAWVRRAGEEEVKTAAWPLLLIDKRRPLTLEDYLRDEDNSEELKARFEQRQQRQRDLQQKREEWIQKQQELQEEREEQRQRERDLQEKQAQLRREWFRENQQMIREQQMRVQREWEANYEKWKNRKEGSSSI
jgi:hypothetical protein